MKLYATVMTVFGLLSVLACAGPQTGGTGTKDDGALITPQRLTDITGIEWHLTKMTLADKSISLTENSKTTFSCNDEGKVAGVASMNCPAASNGVSILAINKMNWCKHAIV